MKVVRVPSAVAAAIAVVLVAGCSASSPGSTPAAAGGMNSGPLTSAATQPTPSGVDAPASGVGAGSGGSLVKCTVVSKAQAQAFQADPITTVTVRPFGSNSDGQDCTFDTDSGGSVEIITGPDSDEMLNYAAQLKEFTKPIPVPGIGDRAARDGNEESGAMISMKNGTVCTVTATDENIPGVGALDLAAGGTNNIGDANYAIIAAALGTLCNRIYGSGNTSPDLTGLRTIVSSTG